MVKTYLGKEKLVIPLQEIRVLSSITTIQYFTSQHHYGEQHNRIEYLKYLQKKILTFTYNKNVKSKSVQNSNSQSLIKINDSINKVKLIQ